MTDAEKMREAAALYHDERAEEETTLAKKYRSGSNPWFAHCQAAKAHTEYAAEIRALPIPVDASAPAADCQQAGLVTVDAAKYGRRNVQKMIRQWDAHRTACRAEGTQQT